MSNVVEVIQQPAMVVEVEMPSGVSSVDAPLTYDPVTQRLGFNAGQVTGLPPSATTGTAVVDADPRLSNPRAPTTHKSTHATGGSDALTPADIGAEPVGTAATSMATHLAAPDPHPQYTTTAEAAAAAPVQSVAGKTGTVTLTPADVGADAAGTAAAAVTAHEAAADPHTQYTTAARVRAVVLTGLSTAVSAAVTAADSILSALGKLQAQITAHVGTGGAAHADATTSTAGFMAAADKTKLDGIAAGATANSSDAQLRDRSTHTGTQAISTVTGLQTALDGKEAVGAATNSMATHLAAADPHSQYTTAAEAAAAAPVQSVAGRTGTVTLAAADIADSTAAGRSVLSAADAAAQRTALGLVLGTDVQAYDADLQAIAALAGSSGLLRKTGANTWSLETAAYLTGNQTVTLSGDATGSGATAITVTLGNSGVTAGTYNDSATQVRPFTVDAKGRVTGIGAAVTITPAWASITGKPTTLSGFGITDAQPLDSDLTAIAALTHAADGFLVSDGTAWTRKTPADALVSLGLGTPTGTGNVVRATSPTIASPTISGVLSLAAGTALLPSLAGPTDPDTGMWFPPGGNTVAWSTGGTERMRISSAGNVGIGTTSPNFPLHVAAAGNNRLAVESTTSGAALIGLYAPTGALAAFNQIQSIVGATEHWAIGGNGWENTLTFRTAGSERMRIDSAGNVGIGTVSPGALLHLRKDTGAVDIRLQVGATLLGTAYASSSDFTLGSVSAIPLIFLANNGERMRISATGEVGIGKTPASSVLLDVNGIIHGGERLQLTNGFANVSMLESSTGVGYRWALANNGTYRLQRTANGTYSDATTPMIFDASNRIGIGTLTPGGLLHLYSTSAFQPQMIVENEANDASAGYFILDKGRANLAVQIGDTLGTLIWRGRDSNNTLQNSAQIYAEVSNVSAGAVDSNLIMLAPTKLQFFTGVNERMRISSAGDVGINETAPDYKLDVNGTFGFTPGASVTPVDNGDVVFEATNNTTFTVKLKGSDGTVRTGTITLA